MPADTQACPKQAKADSWCCQAHDHESMHRMSAGLPVCPWPCAFGGPANTLTQFGSCKKINCTQARSTRQVDMQEGKNTPESEKIYCRGRERRCPGDFPLFGCYTVKQRIRGRCRHSRQPESQTRRSRLTAQAQVHRPGGGVLLQASSITSVNTVRTTSGSMRSEGPTLIIFPTRNISLPVGYISLNRGFPCRG